jgi:hypothetical protein
MLGVTPLLVAGLVEGEENKNVLIYTGATVMFVGFTMVAVFERKTYYIDNPLNTNNKTWSIMKIQ